jgi:zinc and cadmium transporter
MQQRIHNMPAYESAAARHYRLHRLPPVISALILVADHPWLLSTKYTFAPGFFVTISVVLHEIPQELGDFGILIKSGFSRKKALFYNLLSGSSSLVAGILAYFLLDQIQAFIPYTIAIAAASFLYVSMADLIPEMHKETKPKESIIQILMILLGVAIIILSAHEH